MVNYKKYGKEILSGVLLGVILTATAAGTFYLMTYSKRVRSGAGEIKEKILQARNHASNHRTFTAVVFPHLKDGAAPELTCRSLRICEIRKTSGGFIHKSWLGEWHNLPEGNTVSEIYSESGSKEETKPVRYRIAEGKSTFCNCIIFNSRGALHEHRPVYLVLQHGPLKEKLQVRITGMCKISHKE